MIVTWHLDYLVEADVVDLVGLLFVDPIDFHNELVAMAPPAILLALHSSVAVVGLVRGFGLSITLVLLEYCVDSLLIIGVACCEVGQLLCGCAKDERSEHVCVHDIGKLIALLGEAANVLM